MTLDVCLNCRIQATHREGRGQCPRCRGPLLEVDAQTRQPVNRGPAPQSARPGPPASAGPSAPVRTTTQAAPVQRPPAQPRPAVRQPAAQSRPAQPQQSAQLQSAQPQSAQPQRAVPPQSLAARGYPAGRPSAPVNRPQLRWWAHRPVDTIPARPAPPRAAQPRPRYQYMPRWGLPDLRPTAEPNVDGAEGATRRIDWRDLGQSLRLLGAVLAGAALMQLLRYLLVVVNRNRPIPEWLDKLSLISVLVFGCLAVAGALVVLVAFTRWLRDLREADYRRIDRHEPRPAWQLTSWARRH